jgi:GTP pyrophosphokinase
MRLKQREEFARLGREVLAKTFRQAGQTPTEKSLRGALRRFKVKTVEDLHAAVGESPHLAREVLVEVHPAAAKALASGKLVALKRRLTRQGKGKGKEKGKTDAVPIDGLIPGMAVHFAGCCHPLPGDNIVGLVTTGKGVTIHTSDCDVLQQFADQPERWLDVAWSDAAEEDRRHVARIQVIVANQPGTLGTLSTLIAKNDGNITNLKFTTRSHDFFEMLVDIEVADVTHLRNIIAALRTNPVITTVERTRA